MTSRISPETHDRIAQAWPTILEGLARGDLVRDVLRAAGFSRQELEAYRAGDAQVRVEWDAARESSADAFLDEALTVARDPMVEVVQPDDPDGVPIIIRLDSAHARTRIDTLKWAARIRNPRLYGDRATVDVNVRTVDLTRIICEANARLAAAQAPRIVASETLALPSLDDVL